MAEQKWLESADGRSIEQLIELENTHRIDSIIVAIEEALMDKDNPTPTERIVLVVEAMEREVNNGGFNQFFYNSSNEYAWELVPALQQIGVPGVAKIAQRALRAIGAQPDWTHETFEEAAEEPDDPTSEELNACDDAYYSSDEAIGLKLFEFIKVNQADIKLD